MLHAFNADLKKYSKHVKLQLKSVEEERKDMKWEVLLEERSLLDAVK